MLELTRRIGYENARMKAGVPWQTTIGPDLEGLTLGTLGLGKLGQRTCKIAQAFGMKVIAWSQNLTPERCKEAIWNVPRRCGTNLTHWRASRSWSFAAPIQICWPRPL